MRVKLVRSADCKYVNARIISARGLSLPSLTDGWRFNFRKHSQKPGYQCYAIVCDTSPDIIEGCVIFRMKDAAEPYMAYIELAPHNKGENKQYDHVAGCLIAFSCRLSFIHGKDHFKGWLAFDVMEENKADEIKLMSVYSQKYGALKWGSTTMVISPEAGEKLINKYLI